MFEKAVLLGAPRSGGLTAGQIAEALLFYRSVHLVLDAGAVLALLPALGCDGLVELLKRDGVTATFVEGIPVTISNAVGPLTAHSFAFVSHIAKDLPSGLIKGRKQSRMASLATMLLRSGVSKVDAMKLIKAMADLVPNKSLGNGDFGAELPTLALADLKDEAFSQPAIQQVLARMVPEELVPNDFKIKIQESDLGFYLFGDLRIAGIEAARVKRGLPGEPITEALVIGKLLQARVDMTVGAYYGGDFYTSPEISSLIRLRFESLLMRAGLHQAEIAAFEDIVLDGCPSVAEVIDSGERSFHEFLSLLDKAGSFRKWAHAVGPDRKLVTAYLEEVSRQTWLQTSKGKTVRYVLGQATGLDAVASVAFATLDSFGLDSVAERWRASHFVNKRLKPFLED
nr:hypothetical protein [uncultured Roseateles sp.]